MEALGKGEEYTTTTLRFSLGKLVTKDDIDYTVATIVDVIKKKFDRQSSL